MKIDYFTFLLIVFFISCNITDSEDREYYRGVYTYFTLEIVNTDGTNFRNLGGDKFNGQIFFINNGEQFISLCNKNLKIVNLNNLTISDSLTLDFEYIRDAEISFDENNLVLSATHDFYEDIYIIDLIQLTISNITNTASLFERYPSFSHSSNMVIFTTFPNHNDPSRDDQTISIYNLDSCSQEVVISKPNVDRFMHTFVHFYSPKFSLTDSSIFYIKNNLNGAFDSLCVFSNHNVQLLKNNLYHYYKMKISNNAQNIAYITSDSPKELTVMDINNFQTYKIAEYITDALGIDYVDYSFSSDGSKISYSFRNTSKLLNGQKVLNYLEDKLYVANSDGSDNIMIDYGIDPVFSPDGSFIIYHKANYVIND